MPSPTRCRRRPKAKASIRRTFGATSCAHMAACSPPSRRIQFAGEDPRGRREQQDGQREACAEETLMAGTVGIDVGGTYTDLYFSGGDGGVERVIKVPSTPKDPSI